VKATGKAGNGGDTVVAPGAGTGPGRPGNVTFQCGPTGAHKPISGSISFVVPTEGGGSGNVLTFRPNGDFVYRGKLVETDVELYRAFRSFLAPHMGLGALG